MKKTTGRQKEARVENEPDPDEVSAPESFFDDKVLLDYLKALRTPPPKVKLDFEEIHFVHTTDNASKFAEDTVIDNLIHLENDRAKVEAKELRSENEVLKLKVARLIAQLNEAECDLDTMAARNKDLKSGMENLQNQIKIYKYMAKNAKKAADRDERHAPETEPEAPLLVVPEVVVEVVSDLEEMLELEAPLEQDAFLETVEENLPEETVPPQVEQTPAQPIMALPVAEPIMSADVPVEQPAEQISSLAAMFARPAAPAAAVVPEEKPAQVEAGSGRSPERAGVALSQVVDDPTTRKAEPEAPAKKRVVSDDGGASSGRTSKIIRKQDVKKDPLPQKSDPIWKILAPPVLVEDDFKREVELQSEPAAQQPEPLRAAATEAETVPDKELLDHLDVEQANQEAAPVPKAVLRRHMDNYKELQEEADSSDALPAEDRRPKLSTVKG